MKQLQDKVRSFCDDRKLLSKDDSILIALSGGPDSTALLYLMHNLAQIEGFKIAAVHLDHGLRKRSAKDREFCRMVCKKLGVKLYSKQINIAKLSKKYKISLEEAGRNSRYEYFESLSLKYGFSKIATGHTADDNVETILFNLMRGSGINGVAGIAFRRGKIIRPILDIEKTEIWDWLSENKIRYLKDPSNRLNRFTRNKIRNKIIPEIEAVFPSFKTSISRFSKNISEEIEFISDQVVSFYEKTVLKSGNNKIVLDLRKLRTYDSSLRKKIISKAFSELSGGIAHPLSSLLTRGCEIIDSHSGGKSPLGLGIWAENSQNQLIIGRKSKISSNYKLKIPGIIEIPETGVKLEAEILDFDKVKTLKAEPNEAFFDIDKLRDVKIRFWNKGDWIRPFGMKGRKLLSDLFIDKKIPTFEKDLVPIIVVEGKIAWVAGVVASNDFKIQPVARKIVRLKLWTN